MPAPWRGYYINLDSSPERRAGVEATLARAGLTGLYQRFAAITGAEKPAGCRLKPGQYGCFRSHHDLLAGLGPEGGFVHVLEDDAILAQPFGPALQRVIAGGLMEPFDIVFTETMVMPDVLHIHMLKGLFDRNAGAGRPPSLSLIDLETVDFAGTTSYFVNPRSLGRVVESLGRGLATGPARPIDLHYCDEARAGRLRIGLLFPFLSSVTVGTPSTIRPESASQAASLILRNSFFIEADIVKSRRTFAETMARLGPSPPDPRLDLIADILRFTVSDRYRQF
jgi:GR25 family glycosyltransferase involved in LPS biosynthesis